MPPRLTVFAGPNGAGKSSLFRFLSKQGYTFGTYINPDDLAMKMAGSYPAIEEQHTRAAQAQADSIRRSCLDSRTSHCFETVMSHKSKIDYLVRARSLGFHTTLHFVGIASPLLSILRVNGRVEEGGHAVPPQKIIDRYQRSMGFLANAILTVHEAWIYDNSRPASAKQTGSGYPLVAKYVDGICEVRNDLPDIDWPAHYLAPETTASGANRSI